MSLEEHIKTQRFEKKVFIGGSILISVLILLAIAYGGN